LYPESAPAIGSQVRSRLRADSPGRGECEGGYAPQTGL